MQDMILHKRESSQVISTCYGRLHARIGAKYISCLYSYNRLSFNQSDPGCRLCYLDPTLCAPW